MIFYYIGTVCTKKLQESDTSPKPYNFSQNYDIKSVNNNSYQCTQCEINGLVNLRLRVLNIFRLTAHYNERTRAEPVLSWKLWNCQKRKKTAEFIRAARSISYCILLHNVAETTGTKIPEWEKWVQVTASEKITVKILRLLFQTFGHFIVNGLQ